MDILGGVIRGDEFKRFPRFRGCEWGVALLDMGGLSLFSACSLLRSRGWLMGLVRFRLRVLLAKVSCGPPGFCVLSRWRVLSLSFLPRFSG